MDDHVQKTPDNTTEGKEGERPEMKRHGLPDTRVKHIVEDVHVRSDYPYTFFFNAARMISIGAGLPLQISSAFAP